MPLNIDFPFLLTLVVIITGLVALADIVFFSKKREQEAAMPYLIEFSRSFFPALLLVWLIRSFLIQPYRVPTGSLEPTVLPGDFIAVKQFSYGLRFPVLNKKILGVAEPKRGDIALFRWPVDTSKLFVKRVVGLPGDHIVYKNNILTINGQEMPQTYIGKALNIEQGGMTSTVNKMLENLNGIKHYIFIKPGNNLQDIDVVVPEGNYFMLGDNRNDSYDSRDWGFVPESFLVGKAFGIWLSWDSQAHKIRWTRIGRTVG
jgi:signal peptidase I